MAAEGSSAEGSLSEPAWATMALTNATRLASGQSLAGLPLPDCPALLQGFPCDAHSPFFSALCFGGSGSGRHGQGPSQRVVRLLPVEQAWNSILHCKGETERPEGCSRAGSHLALGGNSQCLSDHRQVHGAQQPRGRTEESVSVTSLNGGP